MLHPPEELSHDLWVPFTPQSPRGTSPEGDSTHSRPLYRLVLPLNSFIQSYKPLLTSNRQGIGLKSQSLPLYNYCNLDKSIIKVDFFRKSTTWLSLTRQNTQALHQKAASGQLSSSFHGLLSSIFSTFTSWATRRGSYLTVLSERLLQFMFMTPYSPLSSKFWISFWHLRLR